MAPPLITSDQITLVVTIVYFTVIFGVVLVVDYYIRKHQFLRESFAARVVVGLGVYVIVNTLLFYTMPPTIVDNWLHELLSVPYS